MRDRYQSGLPPLRLRQRIARRRRGPRARSRRALNRPRASKRTLRGRCTAQDWCWAALRYIRKRKEKMRYAQFYKANLPIGSGATESTCWQMQQRVKNPAQSWEPDGLRGVLAMRGLCLSDRWDSAWQPFAAQHRPEVTVIA